MRAEGDFCFGKLRINVKNNEILQGLLKARIESELEVKAWVPTLLYPNSNHIGSIDVDGALDSSHVNVISVVPYLVMKTAALGRGKPKDAYQKASFLVSKLKEE